MRKRWLQGLVLSAVTIVGCLLLLPLYAQNELSLEILEPRPNQIVQGPRMTISVSFKSSDNVNVVRADVMLDDDKKQIFGGPFGKLMSAGSFTDNRCDLTKANPTAGSHKVTIRITDALGRTCEKSTTIMYRPYKDLAPLTHERIAPLVRVSEPKNGDVVEKATRVRVEAADDSGVKLLEVYINGKIRGATNKSTYEFIWDPIEEKFVSGKHDISASAWDIFDNKGTSDPVIVYVKNSFLPESGNWTRPEFIYVNPQEMTTNNLLLPLGQLTRSSILPAWGGSNTIMPELLALQQPKGYTAPMAIIGVVATTSNPLQPNLNTTGGQALAASGLLGSNGSAGRAQSLAPKEALIQTKPLGNIHLTQSAGSPQLPALRANTDELRVIALVPALGSSLPGVAKHSPPGTGALSYPMDTPVLNRISPLEFTAQHFESATLGKTSPLVVLNVGTQDMFPPSLTSTRQETLPQPTIIALVPTTSSHPSAPLTGYALPDEMLGPHGSAAAGSQTLKPAPVTGSTPKVSSTPTTQIHPDKWVYVPAIAKGMQTRPELNAAGPNPSQSLPRIATGSLPNRNGSDEMLIARAPNTTPAKNTKAKPVTTPKSTPVATPKSAPANDNPLARLKGRAPRITMNDAEVSMVPQAYVNSKGYIMIPMRSLVEAKGGILMWFPKTREVTAWVDGDILTVKIGKRTAHVNSLVYIMPAAATLRNARTVVPLNFMVKGMGLKTEYDKKTNRLSLTSK